MKSILITGGCGYIASHTCLLLLNKGFTVYTTDSCVNSSPKSLQNVLRISILRNSEYEGKLHFFKGDIREKETLRNIFLIAQKNNQKINSVLHFAGLKSVLDSLKKPLEYWQNNVYGTINLLDVMTEFECKTIVFSSSASIYGFSGNHLVDENSEVKPVTPYGMTKYVIEKFLNDIYKSSPKSWKIANLRYFNPIGAHSSGLIGENPIGLPSNIFPLILKVALGEIPELKVFGNDWDTFDGTGVRDYIHVMDLAEGHIKALAFLENHNYQILNLNLGTGIGTSVLDLIKTFEKENDVKIPFVFAERRGGDISNLIADNSLAKSTLKWSPERSIKEMCRDGWNWTKNYPKGY